MKFQISLLFTIIILINSSCKTGDINGTYEKISGGYRYNTIHIKKLKEEKNNREYAVIAYHYGIKKFTTFGVLKDKTLPLGFLASIRFYPDLKRFVLEQGKGSIFEKQTDKIESHFDQKTKVTQYLYPDKELDKRTIIKKSRIPGAGNGLFAFVKIKKNEVIGNYGGKLITDLNNLKNDEYLAGLLQCTWKELRPYRYIDGKDSKAHVTRINFAPRKINGIKTNFQNAYMRPLCKYPYFVFIAKKDINPGEEIWTTYGSEYKYNRFMKNKTVRNFFCSLLKIDCSKEFHYSY